MGTKAKSGDMPDRFSEGLINALSDALIIIDDKRQICFANNAAEHFFLLSQNSLKAKSLDTVIAPDSPILALIDDALKQQAGFAEYDMDVALCSGITHKADVKVGIMGEGQGALFLQIEAKTIADKISRQLTHRNAARSVAGAATILAHEIKNPLSGIKGAAQLLEENASDAEKPLAQLISREVDRINELVNTMEDFSDLRPIKRAPLNIHEILDHAIEVVRQGSNTAFKFKKLYDPSLPFIDGNWDKLVQVFINLIKNAEDVLPESKGVITISTAFTHGMRIQVPGSNHPVTLPIGITVADNGPGISDDILPQIFDPFVTTKTNGKGLGLALVSKIIAEHGGVIDCETSPGSTQFHILLPMADKGMNNE